jgi:hypothetical protein
MRDVFDDLHAELSRIRVAIDAFESRAARRAPL